MGKLPSPCISVCKFRIKGGHCIGCSMTKAQKKMFKKLKKDDARAGFVTMLSAQQGAVGSSRGWINAYLKKCAKKRVKAPTLLRNV
ncbi:MAG: DUF1289 domain-containing protein [Pseudomonadota bacterium]